LHTKKGSLMRTVLKAIVKWKLSVLAVVASLTLATTSVALAGSGVGGVFNLGKTNTVNAITKLTGSVAGSSLQIFNNSTDAAATAMELRVASGKPPLKVNSTTKVANLNADRLDDKDSTELAPILRAQQDGIANGQLVSGTTEVNSVAIEAPVDGVLMISGTAYVNNYEPSATDYILDPKVDGSDATPAHWGAYSFAGANGTPGSRFTPTYTVSQPVSAGTHTVTQELGRYGGAPANFFYNNDELSVEFVPGAQASVSDAATLRAAQDSGLSPTGEQK
jgi:hypothetical protein